MFLLVDSFNFNCVDEERSDVVVLTATSVYPKSFVLVAMNLAFKIMYIYIYIYAHIHV